MSLLGRTLFCLLVSSMVSCSAASPAAASRPVPGPMPAGAQWGGLYQGPYHLILNIWTKGPRARGSWRAVGDREGTFAGTTSGNLLTLEWSERAVGTAETWSGRGHFVYAQDNPGQPAEIYGEWGMGNGNRTSSWWAIKRSDQPLGNIAGQIDKDTDQQHQDEAAGSGCEMGACGESTDTDVQ